MKKILIGLLVIVLLWAGISSGWSDRLYDGLRNSPNLKFLILEKTIIIRHFNLYLYWILAISLIIRLLLSIFKAQAVLCGEADIEPNSEKDKSLP